jgi:hypothetical protein
MKIDSKESKFEGDLDVQGFLCLNKNVRNGYQNIEVTFGIHGKRTRAQNRN